jgi:hypothetical protein
VRLKREPRWRSSVRRAKVGRVIPVIETYPLFPASQADAGHVADRWNGTSRDVRMTRRDLCIGSIGGAQRPEALRSKSLIPV